MKLENWEASLAACIEKAVFAPFQYGVCDCVVFASDAVLAQTGIDPMLEGRGKYSTLRDGALLISKHRGSYEGIMDFYFNRLDNTRKAQRGDVLLKHFDGAPAYGVCFNGKVYFKGETGLAFFKPSDCEIAWRVD